MQTSSSLKEHQSRGMMSPDVGLDVGRIVLDGVTVSVGSEFPELIEVGFEAMISVLLLVESAGVGCSGSSTASKTVVVGELQPISAIIHNISIINLKADFGIIMAYTPAKSSLL